MSDTNDQSTLDVDPNAKAAATIKASQAPAGSGGSALPAVGTNEVDQWQTWDPNQWWTNWSIPAKPQATWELWFQWVNQLSALVPSVNQASTDWQTLTSQFDNALQTVRTMRGQLTEWTGPSAQTMSQSLDRLETSISTKADAIRNNPMKLQDLASAITDAVGPMQQLDAQYQQVLTNDAECRQVAMQGQPIMIGLATKLLQAGTDIENSAQISNLAPQPTPPQQAATSTGPQGPTSQLAQVAGSNGNADPGTVSTGSQIPIAVQSTTAGPSGVTDPGSVQTAQQQAMAHAPGVAVSPGGSSATATGLPAQSTAHVAATPTLAGTSAGTVAPTVTTFGASAPMPTAGPGVSMTPMAGPAFAPAFGAAVPARTPSANRSTSDDRTELAVVPIVLMPMGGGVSEGTTGSVAVPAALHGRNRTSAADAATAGVIRPAADPDIDVFRVPDTDAPRQA